MRTIAALSLVVAACAGNNAAPADDSQPARLDHLAYEVPASWTHTDTASTRGPSSQWLPQDNPRKESLIVTRSKVLPGFPALDTAALQTLVMDAQQQLPHARIAKTEPFTTKLGLHGVRVETDFLPVGATGRYVRIHAVLLDGDGLVNVMYTARDSDGGQAFDLVVNSVHGEA